MENAVEQLSKQIAEKLLQIKQAKENRIVLENKLEEMNLQVESIKQSINNCDNTIKSCKYQINERLSSMCNDKINLVTNE